MRICYFDFTGLNIILQALISDNRQCPEKNRAMSDESCFTTDTVVPRKT